MMRRKALSRRGFVAGAAAGAALLGAPAARAGVEEIRIGSICPYSGPASAYGVIGQVQAAWFRKVNDGGGVNGRPVRFISRDDAYNPARALEQTRRLVESDGVLAVFNPLGAPSNTAIRQYLNDRRTPQLFVASGATKWGDWRNYPWTISGQPSYQAEAQVYARLMLERTPAGRIGVLYQNDDFGRDYLKGLAGGLGDRAERMIVAREPYETGDATVDGRLLALKAAGADVAFIVATPKFAAQAIRRMAETGWRPERYLVSVSQTVAGVMRPAGLANGAGVISSYYLKDPADPAWRDDPAMAELNAFLDRYLPGADRNDILVVYGYVLGQLLTHVLERCGDELTRDNLMRQATSIRELRLGLLLPGVTISTGPQDYFPFKQLQPLQFDGERWRPLGGVVATEARL
ncbi:ABC transporter substrate-binding protein [Camelimonas abortus]|uniref:ABC transporter substrate-binding protein n=1 Tax=Camelimonas abortus TaxID=1017184 RepID=A0ABV7LF00_9HYPH